MSTTNSSVNYAVDAAGNLTSDGLRTFEYDAANRISKARVFKDGEEASIRYLHNAVGQRVFKGEPTASQTLPSEQDLGTGFIDWLKKNFKWLYANAQANTSIGTAYVYGDGEIPNWALLGEYDNGSAKGAGRSEFIWLPTEDGSAIPVGMIRNGKLFAIHSDHLGTPRLMTNDQNQPVWQWPYSAFGNNKPTGILKATPNPKAAITNVPVLLKATGATEFNLRFPGQYFDVEAGTNYNHLRDGYDPFSGRYRQPDPIGRRGGLNVFAYANQNPLMLTDPDGLCPCGEPADVLDLARSDKRDWSKKADRRDVNNGFGPDTNKCNLYADTQYEDAGYNLPNIGGGLFSRALGKYPPGAGELSKPDYKVPGWPTVSGPAQPGDLVASGGHVGIATSAGTTISASPGGVVENSWGFRPGQQRVIRRCSCAN